MALKVTVKVGSITNLSDARYCAGMGVHMLGFVTHTSHDAYLSPSLFQEMRGWFSGPLVVAEVYGIANRKELEYINTAYRPDMLEGGINELEQLLSADLPYILNTENETLQDVQSVLASIQPPAYLICGPRYSETELSRLMEHYKVLFRLPELNASEYLHLPVTGFVLSGTDEERPGLKDYKNLSEILEMLEEI